MLHFVSLGNYKVHSYLSLYLSYYVPGSPDPPKFLFFWVNSVWLPAQHCFVTESKKAQIATKKENTEESGCNKSGCGRQCLPVNYCTINRDHLTFLYGSKCASAGVANHGGFFPARTLYCDSLVCFSIHCYEKWSTSTLIAPIKKNVTHLVGMLLYKF
jgi:hypothetical protein